MYYEEGDAPAMAEETSPYVDKMREYVDIERSIDRAERDAKQIAQSLAEMRAKQNQLRGQIDAYLNGDRAEAVEVSR